jgi:nucleotide-binding universal stress UspA family protein
MDGIRTKTFVACELPGTKVILGEPLSKILTAFPNENINMIVMGTHDRKGPGHIMVGSIAEKVLRKSTVPVILVNLSTMNGTLQSVK